MKFNLAFIGLFTFTWVLSNSSFAQLSIQFEPINSSINSPDPVQSLDIPYDDINQDRQAFHLFLPDTDGQFPVVIFYHGGGFTGGSRDKVFEDEALQRAIKYFLENGIAFISAGYRLIDNRTEEEGVIKSLKDSKRALQFIRHYAEDLHIMPERIGLMGSSAGAGTALWLATHNDMADPNSEDPVLQESTRVTAVRLGGSQATYDIPKWESLVYLEFGFTLADIEAILGFDRLSDFYGGLESVDQIYQDEALIAYREEVDMLNHMSADDPPLYILSSSGASLPEQDVFHHGAHSIAIWEQALAANLPEVKAAINFQSIDTTEGEIGEIFLARHLKNGLEEAPLILSVSDNEHSRIRVYPNPTAETLYLENQQASTPFKIFDLNGRLVKSGTENTIDVSGLDRGIYLLTIKQETIKFVKE
ncbi:MAG: T9SS type A sorting domain-containing protein [Cytophagales bacterium]|nr:T9SS type A sorting domain-containing protein [Cytophagales bacterium]